jgi:hypothetical protein
MKIIRSKEFTAERSWGALDIAKGHDFVLRAYAASKAMNRLPLQLLGQQETPLVPALKALGRSLGITELISEIDQTSEGRLVFRVTF